MTDAIRRLKDRATALLAQGKLGAALEAFRAVLKAAPGDLTARQKVAELLTRQGHAKAAVEEYVELVRRYAEQGQFFKASALCRVVLTLEPSHRGVQERLAELYAARRAPPTAAVALPKVAPLERATVAPPAPTPAIEEEELELFIEEELPPTEAEPPPPPRGALPHVPLFSSLSNEELIAVLSDAMEVRAFADGEVILREGEPGTAMYALAQGAVSVLRGEKVVARMEEGAFFGEMALLSGAARLATLVAAGEVVLLEFPRESMERLVARHPNIGVGLEGFFRDRLLANALRANPLLSLLTEAERGQLVRTFAPCAFRAGEVLLEEGRPGEAVFLLLRGRCGVFHRAGAPGRYPDLLEGDLCGEISVVAGTPVTAMVQAREPGVALRVGAADFRALVLANPAVKSKVVALAAQRMARTRQLSENDLRV
ncbi:MAG: cyclic nucleotide-binding domain-containing protein [Myxococcota bacterium]